MKVLIIFAIVGFVTATNEVNSLLDDVFASFDESVLFQLQSMARNQRKITSINVNAKDLLQSNIHHLVGSDGESLVLISMKSFRLKQVATGFLYEISGTFEKDGKAEGCDVTILTGADAATKIKAKCDSGSVSGNW